MRTHGSPRRRVAIAAAMVVLATACGASDDSGAPVVDADYDPADDADAVAEAAAAAAAGSTTVPTTTPVTDGTSAPVEPREKPEVVTPEELPTELVDHRPDRGRRPGRRGR